jgi:FtsP/CotA-like multicopper oxidase with cupredoxin domain
MRTSGTLRWLVLAAGTALAACGPAAGSSPTPDSMAGMNMTGNASPSMSAAQMDQAMAQSMKSFPAKQKGTGAQPLQPKVLPGGIKEFDLTAEQVQWEVSPGKVVTAMTYNGTVPGPTIHVNPGDHVQVVLTNKLPEPTVMHIHGLELPNAMDGVPYITQDPIDPGKSFTYDFVAKGPATAMYHSHFDTLTQDSDGMYGAFLVGEEPVPAGVTVSQEIPFMLNDSGTIGLTFNGKGFPETAPISAKLGDWIVVHYYNAGEMAHPIHLHDIPQLVIAEDGFPVPNPYTVDTVNIAPGQRFTVLIHADNPGVWAWHCHILAHAENSTGMMGMVTALIVK